MKGHSAFNPFLTLLVALLVSLAAMPCSAGTARYWTGSAGDGSWINSTNWSGGCPQSGTDDTVYFLSTGAYAVSPSNNFSSPIPFSLKSLTFNSGAAPVTLGGNAILLDATSANGGIFQNSANPVRINNALSWTGTNTFTIKSQGAGGLILAGSLSTATTGSLVTIGAGSVTFSTATFGTGTNGNLRVGDVAPASLTVQDRRHVAFGGELDVNYGNTLGGVSTLTLKSGSLAVAGTNRRSSAGRTCGLAPSTTSAAFTRAAVLPPRAAS